MSRLRHAVTVDDWSLVVSNTSGEEVVLHPEQRSRFWADPFFVPTEDGSVRLLCEEFDYRTDRGTIVDVSLDEDLRVRSVGRAFNTTVHEAYPYVLCHDDAVYCIPEMAESGDIPLYELVDGGWRVRDPLIQGVAGLDTTVVFDDALEQFVLFTTPQAHPNALEMWTSRELSGPWERVGEGPVVEGPRGSRCAGRPWLSVDGRWQRPGQNGAERYGGSIIVNEIRSLTPFDEVEVDEIGPPDDFEGTHTIDRWGGYTVVDAVRRISPLGSREHIEWRIRNVLGRSRILR